MRLPAAGAVIPVDKPPGPTSHDVVAVARRALGTRRVGHTGTLDPFASGLLLLCVGRATRLVEFLTALPKRYVAGVRLGVRTTTDDSEGGIETISEAWRSLTRARVEQALERFRGTIRQTPPRYSAKKIGGIAAHYRVRRGEDVVLDAVEVVIHELDMVVFDPPDLELRVACSSGTYIRAIARDLGDELACGAHLATLRRTSIGTFQVARAITVESLGDPEVVAKALVAPAAAIAHLPRVEVGPEEAAALASGQPITVAPEAGSSGAGAVAVLLDRELVAVATREGKLLRPRKVFLGGGS